MTHQHIELEDQGRVVGQAELETDGTGLRAALHVVSGHHRPDTGARLVDAVLDESHAEPGTPVHITLPAGDAEALLRLRERCDDLHARSAGATVLADGTLATP